MVVAGPAARQVERLPESAAAAVIETFGAIGANPYRLGKPLRFELEGLWSARRGPYRVIYEIDASRRRVIIIAVGHRSDIYRRR